MKSFVRPLTNGRHVILVEQNEILVTSPKSEVCVQVKCVVLTRVSRVSRWSGGVPDCTGTMRGSCAVGTLSGYCFEDEFHGQVGPPGQRVVADDKPVVDAVEVDRVTVGSGDDARVAEHRHGVATDVRRVVTHQVAWGGPSANGERKNEGLKESQLVETAILV